MDDNGTSLAELENSVTEENPIAVKSDMLGGDLTNEKWREYEFFVDDDSDVVCIYRIKNPQKLFIRKGGTTHRVLDAKGVVHCVPGVGQQGCVLRWKPRKGTEPVAF